MAWPQANEFQEAVQNPRLAFSDPDLQSSEAKTNALGLPHAVSGQFGIVYEMKAADGRCWAVKCFTGPSSDRQRRYQAIGARLKQVNLPFMVGIDYLEQGIRIGGQWYPVLKMDWVEGQTLNEFVGQRVDQPHLLEGLLDMWVKVAQRLRETDVTHADLQHGNVMLIPGIVEGKVSLRLVDYDGMYLPALAGLPSGEMGHRDFQHPKRLATSYYGPEVDRFSHLVIYTALLAVREKGKVLWDKYSTGDNLLFTQADFANPGNSKILLDLWREGSDDLRALTGRLVLATRQSLKDVPHLNDVLTNGRVLPLTGEQVRDVNRNLNGEQSQQRPALPARVVVDQPPVPPRNVLVDLHRRWTGLIPNKRTRLGVVWGLVGILLLMIGFIAAGGHRGKKPKATEQEKEIGPIAANQTKAKIKTTPPKKTKDDLQPTAIEPQAKTLLVPDDKLLTFDLGSNVNLEMVKIHAKGKKFVMGSPKEEDGRGNDEEQHEVSFNHDFYLGKFEVTQEQYEAIMGTNPSSFKGAKNPVETVSWDDAQEFIKKLNAKFKDRNVTFRLPSEAEWEYACRAGTTTPFHFGSESNGKQSNCDGSYPYGTIVRGPYLNRTRSVSAYEANAFGLYDMHGNVCEWCEDYYGPYSEAPKGGTSQRVKQSGDHRVLRGGCWEADPGYCRSAKRVNVEQGYHKNHGGFRVALTPQDNESKTDLPKGKDPVVVAPPSVVSDERTKYELGSNVHLEMVKISAKGKKFQMGSPKDEADRNVNEEQREVSFNHDFYIGKFEVTQEQYLAIMGTNPSKFKGAKSPVETVSWDDAQEFIKRLNAKFKDRKGTFRLPSEAEWEYACRAGTTTPFHFGKELNGSQANSTGTNPYGTTIKGPYLEKTRDVGGYEANAFGLYDMHGNVLEWCEDYYGAYKDSPTDGTAQTAKLSSNVRVFRGGSWGDLSKDCRSAYRSGVAQDSRNEFIGFRVAMSLLADDIIYDLGNTVKLDMIKINAKGKKFMMGSPKDEAGRNDNEEQHEVLFNHDFYIGKFEVTQEQYEAIMGTNPSSFKGAKNPVETVSWDDAQEFLKKMNAKFKDRQVTFRLPSEAEWEYACRAGTTTPFHFGTELNGKQANSDGTRPYATRVEGPYLRATKSVGSYDANGFLLYDMHGNVWEWCEDDYGPYSTAPKDGTAQRVKQSSGRRVVRGGSWGSSSEDCRSAYRDNIAADDRFLYIGFRVALSPQAPEQPPAISGKTDDPIQESKKKDELPIQEPKKKSESLANVEIQGIFRRFEDGKLSIEVGGQVMAYIVNPDASYKVKDREIKYIDYLRIYKDGVVITITIEKGEIVKIKREKK